MTDERVSTTSVRPLSEGGVSDENVHKASVCPYSEREMTDERVSITRVRPLSEGGASDESVHRTSVRLKIEGVLSDEFSQRTRLSLPYRKGSGGRNNLQL